MTEKLTMKKLSDELEQLRTQMQELEARLQHHFESKLESALAAAKSITQPQPTSIAVPLTSIDAEQRQHLITIEAYLIAERRGFEGCDPSQDWAEAEKLVPPVGDEGRPAACGGSLSLVVALVFLVVWAIKKRRVEVVS